MTKKEQELARCAAWWADLDGEVLSKCSDPFAAGLQMKLKTEGLTIDLTAMQSPYSNGSTCVKIRKGNKVLLEANGDMWFRFEVKKRVPGDWEELVLKNGKRHPRYKKAICL